MRLAMKPGVSLQRTMLLPRTWSQKDETRSTSAGSVAGPGTTSSSRM